MSYNSWKSSQRTSDTQITDSRQAALICAANYITFRSDLLHMVEKLKIAFGMSWKCRRMSWIRNGENIGI
jgi:hypothetical protein